MKKKKQEGCKELEAREDKEGGGLLSFESCTSSAVDHVEAMSFGVSEKDAGRAGGDE